MSSEIDFVEDIVPGKIDWTLKVRVIHLWKVLNKLRNDEVNNIEMLLLDEKVNTFSPCLEVLSNP